MEQFNLEEQLAIRCALCGGWTHASMDDPRTFDDGWEVRCWPCVALPVLGVQPVKTDNRSEYTT